MCILYISDSEMFHTCRRNHGLKNHISSIFIFKNMIEFFVNESQEKYQRVENVVREKFTLEIKKYVVKKDKTRAKELIHGKYKD